MVVRYVIVNARMYEIEIKSLLGNKERADKLKNRLTKRFPLLKTLPRHKQRNHYFNEPEDLKVLPQVIAPLLSEEKKEKLAQLIANITGSVRADGASVASNGAGTVSIRTREADGVVSFILKASIGDDSSANGVSRIEFDEPVKLSLQQLDKRLLDSGLSFQAKWSREREEYVSNNTHITIDKNAGYGYLAEFEQVVDDKGKTDEVKRELSKLMNELGAEELPQERLERMFAHYNKHWKDYYGTEKTFIIK